jgi:glycerol-1-phosphate dehydrogenase [NAD(P)+]
VCEPDFILDDPELYAEHRFVEQLEAAFAKNDAVPVVVGSGSLNDLVKLAAHRAGRRYMVVATAASMDGYTAFGASITCNGSKQTFDCGAPLAVLADLDVIGAAPAPMNAAGYADLAAKITAGADWIVADALNVEPIDATAWPLVQDNLRNWLAGAADVGAGDIDVIGGLTEGLMMTGFAMQSLKSSRPASGSEHQFSHLWDMQFEGDHRDCPSHGFKVGIATLAVTALYEQLLAMDFATLDIDRLCSQWPASGDQAAAAAELCFSSDALRAKAAEETRAKHVSREQLRSQLLTIQSAWPALKDRLQTQLIPSAQLKQMLAAAGAPTQPGQIGITPQRLKQSFRQAYHIRRRYTVLDLAVRTGVLDAALEQMQRWNRCLSR